MRTSSKRCAVLWIAKMHLCLALCDARIHKTVLKVLLWNSTSFFQTRQFFVIGYAISDALFLISHLTRFPLQMHFKGPNGSFHYFILSYSFFLLPGRFSWHPCQMTTMIFGGWASSCAFGASLPRPCWPSPPRYCRWCRPWVLSYYL